jgi:hypothetical protein
MKTTSFYEQLLKDYNPIIEDNTSLTFFIDENPFLLILENDVISISTGVYDINGHPDLTTVPDVYKTINELNTDWMLGKLAIYDNGMVVASYDILNPTPAFLLRNIEEYCGCLLAIRDNFWSKWDLCCGIADGEKATE